MKNFTYYQPKTVEEAIGLLDDKWGTTELLAGGTDLHDLQKEYVAQPEKVVSLTGITAGVFQTIGVSKADIKPGHWYIGGGVTLAAIADHKSMLPMMFPALIQAAKQVGGPQIRNMGTLAGNLCQRNRCWYFRDEQVNCLLKGGSKCFALDGENRYHAIFPPRHQCVIVHPSTLAPALIALGATAQIQGPKGNRTLEIAKLFHAPSSPTEREHLLAPDEILISVTIPDPYVAVPSGEYEFLRNASYEVRHKQSYDWPLVQAVAAFTLERTLERKKATNVRIVLGHVAPTPHIAEDAAKELEGKEVTEASAAAAGKAATNGAKPLSQNAYKVKLVEVAVKRAILTAAGQKKYWEE